MCDGECSTWDSFAGWDSELRVERWFVVIQAKDGRLWPEVGHLAD